MECYKLVANKGWISIITIRTSHLKEIKSLVFVAMFVHLKYDKKKATLLPR